MVDQDHGGATADVVAGQVGEDAGAGVIELQVYRRAVVVGEAGLGIVDVVAGEFHLLAHQQLAAFGGGQQFIAGRHGAGFRLLQQCGVVGHHAHFQCGGAADDVFGFGGVLHAGQLHHDTVGAGLLDNRLGHAQFVHAVMQGVDVLLHGGIADLRLSGFGQAHHQVVAVSLQFRIRSGFFQLGQGGLQGGRILEGHNQRIAAAAHIAGADFVFTQLAAEVAGDAVEGFVHCRVHIHAHGEVHAAAQVKAEEHRVGAELGHPIGRIGNQVEGDDVVVAQFLLDGIAGFALQLFIGQAHAQAAFGNKHAVVLDVGCLQRLFHGLLGGLVDVDRLAVGGNLHGRGFAVEVGQGVDGGYNDNQPNQQVFPKRITVHNGLSETENGQRGRNAAAAP